MTTMEIARQRLQNQRIHATPFEGPEDVVQWLVVVQAQDYAGAKWAVGLRLLGATDGDVEQAFNDGAILRTHLLRPTWHFVTPADIRWLLALTVPQVHAVNAHMYRKLGLDDALFQLTNSILTKALQGGHQLTREELRTILEEAGISARVGQRMSYIMMRAELDGIVCSGARRGKQFTYALLDERAPYAELPGREEALAKLARRYIVSHGPATVQDFAKWSGLTVTEARSGLEMVREQLQHEFVNGKTYWSPASTPAVIDDSPSAYLLSIYDEYISGYKYRTGIIDEKHAENLRALGNALSYIILVDGQIVGTWKRTIKKDEVVVETNLFTQLTKAEKRAVFAATQKYGAFINLPVVLT